MLAFMQGVAPYPQDVSLLRLGVHVDARALKLLRGQPLEEVGQERCRGFDPLGHRTRQLVGVGGQDRPFVTVHRYEGRALFHQSKKHPLTLDDEHITDVTPILKDRPHSRLWSVGDHTHGVGSVEASPKRCRSRSEPGGDIFTWQFVVDESALLAAHRTILPPGQRPWPPETVARFDADPDRRAIDEAANFRSDNLATIYQEALARAR